MLKALGVVVSFLLLIHTCTWNMHHFFSSNWRIYTGSFLVKSRLIAVSVLYSCSLVSVTPSHHCHLSQVKSTLLWLAREIYVKMTSSLSLLFSFSGESCISVLFLWFFTSPRIVMSTSVSFSQVPIFFFSSFALSPLPTLIHLFQERLSSLHSPFLFPCSFYELEKAPHLGWQVTHLCQGNKQNLLPTLMWNVYKGYSGGFFDCRM